MKKLSTIILAAIALTSCEPGRLVGANAQLIAMRKERRAQIKIKEGETVAFKDIQGKQVILENRPSSLDSITISLKKP